MWQIEKDVLYPARVVVADPKGQPLTYHFTQADMADIERTGNAKIRDGWNIPLVWEHQNEAPERRKMIRLSRAEREREFARGVFGCSTRFVVRDGRLRAVLSGDDDADLKQFAKVKFVSPEIQWDWRDSDGKVWRGPTITHIAATPRPVQRHQEPVRLSQTPEVFRLAEFLRVAAGVPRVGVRMHPPKIRLSLSDFTEVPSMPPETNAGATPWERIATALQSRGIKIGDGKNIKDADHLADLVDVACMNSGDPDLDLEPELPEPDPEPSPEGDLDAPPDGAAPPPGPPIQMSQRAQERAERLERRNLGLEIASLERERRIGPAVAQSLRERVKTVRLSFGSDGEPAPNEVSIRIEAFKQNPPGSAWNPTGRKKTRLSHTAAAPESPFSGSDGRSDDEVVAAFEQNVGR